MLHSVCMMRWFRMFDLGHLASLSAKESGRDIEVLGLLRCSIWILLGLMRCVGLEALEQAFSIASRLLEGGRVHRVTVHGLGINLPPGSCFGKHLVKRDGREDDAVHESFGSLELKPWAVPRTYSSIDKGGMHRMLVMDLCNGVIRKTEVSRMRRKFNVLWERWERTATATQYGWLLSRKARAPPWTVSESVRSTKTQSAAGPSPLKCHITRYHWI